MCEFFAPLLSASTSSAMVPAIFTRGVMSCPLGASVGFTLFNDEPFIKAGRVLHVVVVVVEMEAGRAGGGGNNVHACWAWRVK